MMRFRVVWDFGDTMASFSPRIRFNRVDLPTLGGPRIPIKPEEKLMPP
jgi:hypothetical protein